MTKSIAKTLEEKKARLEKLAKEVNELQVAMTKQERKDRDTALFTVGAVFLAVFTGEDNKLRSEFISLFDRAKKAHPLEFTDHRRKCYEKVFVEKKVESKGKEEPAKDTPSAAS